MSYLLLIPYFILSLNTAVYSEESSSFAVKDICQPSSIIMLQGNYTFMPIIGSGGLLPSGQYIEFNTTTETECYWKCCNNTFCDLAWYFNKTCVTFQCNWTKTEECLPMFGHADRFQLSKVFLLRTPKNHKDSISATTMTTIIDATTSVLTTEAKPTTRVLTVAISKNQTLTLPVNHVILAANVINDKELTYLYQWTLLSKPSDTNSGKLDTTKTKELKLTDLIVGEYHFQVEVSGNNSYGKADVFVIVNPAKKLNMAPIAKIEPHNQTVQLPNNVILDGSKSSDDSKITSYYWELVKGPIEAEKKIKNDESMLNLENLSAGNYTFKLTVKDETGALSSDTAFLEVLPEKDYPPVVDPGNNIIVELPVKFIILNGSGSHDDKKIVSYQWTKKSDGLTADIQGVREPILNLTNLQEGTYTFNLMVTDSNGQSADKDVQVFVKPRTNSHPVARASTTEDKSVTVRLPATEAILNGSLSTDDEKITQYEWKQIEGHPILNVVDADKPVAYIYDLKIGLFKFNLTVYDKERLADSDVVVLRINESNNQKPKAVVGGIPEYHHLEANLIKVDGSSSWDDVQITQYKWTREDDSLAVGQILENSDSSPILLLTDLVPGVYKFKLQVFDAEGLSESVVATLDILPSRYEMYLVELKFLCSIHQFTESRKNAFINNIQLIVQKKLDPATSRVVIHTMKLDKVAFQHSVTIVFYVTLNKESGSSSTRVATTQQQEQTSNTSTAALVTEHNAPIETSSVTQFVATLETSVRALDIVEALNMVRHNSEAMEYQILRVETFVCQNNCSSHGTCNKVTKLCECDTYWMGSFIRERFGDGRPNCDWSVIYLSISIAFIIFSLIFFCWFIVWIKQRRNKAKKNIRIRKHKYVKVNGYDQENGGAGASKVPKSLSTGVKVRIRDERASESIFNSDSTLSSDNDEVAFVKTHHRGDRASTIVAPSWHTTNGDITKSS